QPTIIPPHIDRPIWTMTGRTRLERRMRLAMALLAACQVLAAAESPPGESHSAVGNSPVVDSAVINVLPAQLNAHPPGANWLSYNGDFTGRRYSKLSQINLRNVGQLRAQWVFHPGNSNRLEVTPVVVNGIMFVTSANDTYALDA